MHPDRRGSRVGAGLLLAAVVGGPLIACSPLEYRSIHFHDAMPNFLRMPQPWLGHEPEKRALAPVPPDYYDAMSALQSPDGGLRQLEREARAAEGAGQFPEAAKLWARWQAFYNQSEHQAAGFNDGTGAPQIHKPSLPDRIAALRAWRHPGQSADLKVYLRARDAVDDLKTGKAEALLTGLTREPYRSHAEYLRASILYGTARGATRAAEGYRRLLARNPKHQAARYMLGRIAYQQGIATDEEDGTPRAATQEMRPHLRAAAKEYDACARLDPSTSLGLDATGMAGGCYYRLQEYPEALLRYCRQLAALKPGEENFAAMVSADWCLGKMSLEQHAQFQKLAVAEPICAAIYLDLNLYYGTPGAKGLHRLGLYAVEVLKRHPRAPLSGRLLTHLALVEDRAGRYANAERLATAALRASPAGILRDQARWQYALTLHHQGRFRPAMREYETLATGAGLAKMRRGAHEAAALVAERAGDYPGALYHYFALEYRSDYGYVADCLASPNDLRAFLKRYPRHPRANLIRYSLAFRQMRAGEYAAAISTFRSLGSWLDVAEKAYAADTSRKGKRWPPLKMAGVLLNCEQQEARARTDREKAKWAYEAARAIFHQRHLVFYNGALWKGGRTTAFEWGMGPKNVEKPFAPLSAEEKRTYERYQEEHAALYQALQRFLKIAKQYPKTPEAPKALYSAALCYSFLPSLESYWGTQRKEDYAAKEVECYHRIQRDYPRDPLAVAARKWGGPAPVRKAAGG